MAYDRLEFLDALKTLAAEVGLELPQASVVQQEYTGLYTLLEKASSCYQSQLQQNKAALSYLQTRGLTVDIIQRFKLGYALNNWDNILIKLAKSDDERKQLLECGLIVKSEQGKLYDRFRHRITFPIRD